MISKEQLQLKAKQFLDTYESDYKENKIYNFDYDTYEPLRDFILRNIYDTYINPKGDENIIFGILAELNLYEKEKNPYNIVFQDIINKYGINKNILDVCCGIFPNISKLIDDLQTSGSITACDTQLIKSKKIGNIIFCQENFNNCCNKLKDKDLIISRMPDGKIFPKIIEQANLNEIEFYIIIGKCMELYLPKNHFNNKNMNSESKYNLWYKYINEIIYSTLPENFTFIKEEIYNPITKEYNKVIRTKKRS